MKCRNCSKETGKWGKRDRYYCSYSCYSEYSKNNVKSKFIRKDKECPICKNIFTTNNVLQKYCSPPCQFVAAGSRTSKKSKTSKCKVCKKTFYPYTSLSKFCSANCRIENMKSKRSCRWNKQSVENRKGKNNPGYKDGNRTREVKSNSIGKRPYIRIRNKIRAEKIEEYGYLFCDKCGTNKTYQWETHHLIYRSEKPNHEHIHHERNLIDLCIKCHNWFHEKKARRNPYVEERNLVELFGNDILR